MARRRKPKRPSIHRPGTPGKIQDMADRESRGEHLYHAQDPGMQDIRQVRVPVISAGNYKVVDWRVMDEQTYREENHHESWWGDRQELE